MRRAAKLIEVCGCALQGGAAGERLAQAQAEAADAEAELSRVQLEGPANHRKRDPIDKARPFPAVLDCIKGAA